MFTNRSPITCLLLSIVTCSIYYYIWMWQAINELYNAGKKSSGDLDPIVQFILLFVPPVGFIFFAINADDNLNEVRMQRGMPTQDNKVLYLILSIVLPIAMIYLVQDEMNKLA